MGETCIIVLVRCYIYSVLFGGLALLLLCGVCLSTSGNKSAAGTNESTVLQVLQTILVLLVFFFATRLVKSAARDVHVADVKMLGKHKAIEWDHGTIAPKTPK